MKILKIQKHVFYVEWFRCRNSEKDGRKWTEMIQEAKKKEQRRQAIEILTKSKSISFKDIHIIGKMLQD